ncbi:MAG TPA: hypothetical protein DDW76_31495 [Cyanobacteria bacterium UBA11369]|nr:hypothetical protein [Cyanobacteria bacterium UBA8543]HBE30729.1 hypothetical protein [Cyanobacteria bacterium UBA11368]HBE53166.1 hypothetical protein [Cyanobacteria bacterium UBA11369]
MKTSRFKSVLALLVTAVVLLSDAGEAFARRRIRPNLSPRNATPRTNIIRTRIRGLTIHGRQRIYGRDGGIGVSGSALLDAVRNGQVRRGRDKKGRRFIQYRGRNATVNINRRGRVITAWPENRNGWRRR